MHSHGDLRILHKDDLKVLLTAAADQGATAALQRLGLADEKAAEDLRELRDWLDMVRDAKKEAWRTVVKLFTTLALTALMAGLAIKFKLFGGNP